MIGIIDHFQLGGETLKCRVIDMIELKQICEMDPGMAACLVALGEKARLFGRDPLLPALDGAFKRLFAILAEAEKPGAPFTAVFHNN